MKMKMKNKFHRCDICIKQHLRNIGSSIHEKVKQQWGWLEKSVAYKKSV